MARRDLHENEKLLSTYRKHEVTLLPKLLEVFLLLFVPWFLGIKYDLALSSPTWEKIFAIYTLLVVIYGLRFIYMWRINVYLITDQRLLYIHHPRLFKKVVNETPLDRILNVSFRTTGFFSTLFHYGDVLVHIVGLDEPLVFEDVPNPSKLKDFIWRMHSEFGTKDIVYVPHAPKVGANPNG